MESFVAFAGLGASPDPASSTPVSLGGTFHVECFGPDGNRKWRVKAKNAVVNVALNDWLNVYLRNGTPKAAWYLGLVDNSGFTTFAAADTMASHAGWTESTVYSNATRPTWAPGAASSQSVTNSSSVDFAVTGTATLRGIFLNSASDKGGTTGTLFSTAAFTGGNQAVANGDTLKVTYSVSSAAA
jgi:hypothetical protein